MRAFVIFLFCFLMAMPVWGGDYYVKSYDVIIDATYLSMRNPRMAALQKTKLKNWDRCARIYETFSVRDYDGNKSAYMLRRNNLPPLNDVFHIMIVKDEESGCVDKQYFNGDPLNQVLNDVQVQKLFDDFKAEGTVDVSDDEIPPQVMPRKKAPKKDKVVE